MDKELKPILFTEKELETIASFIARYSEHILPNINSIGTAPGLAHVIEQQLLKAPVLTVEDLRELDLGEFATGLFGITDPIGQLQGWLYDRLKEFTSWIAQTVETVFRTIVNTVIMPAIEGIANSLKWIADQILRAIGGFPSILDWLSQGLQQVLTNFTTAISNALNTIWGNITSGLQSVMKFLTEDIPNAVSSLVETITTLAASIQQSFKTIWETISSALQEVAEFISKELPQRLQEAISGFAQQVQETMTSIVNTITQGFTTVWETINSALQNMVSFLTTQLPQVINNIVDAAKQAVETIGSSITQAFQEIWGRIEQGIKSLADFLTVELPKAIESIGETVQDVVSSVATSIQRTFQPVIESISKALQGVLEIITKDIPNAVKQIPNVIQGVVETLIENITTGFTKLWESLRSNIEGLVDYLSRNLPAALETIAKTVTDVTATIRESLTGIIDLLQQAFNAIKSFLTEELPKAFEHVIDTISKAVEEAATFVKEKVLAPVTEGTKKLWETTVELAEKARETIVGTVEQFTERFKELPKAVEELWNAILGGAKTVEEVLSRIGEAVWAAVPDWLRNGLQMVIKVLTNDLPHFIDYLKKVLTEDIPRFFAAAASALQNPYEFLRKHVAEPILAGLSWVGEAILKGLQGIWGSVTKAAEWLWSVIIGTAQNIGKVILDVFIKARDTLTSFFTSMYRELFAKPMRDLTGEVGKGFLSMIKEAVSSTGKVGEAQIFVSSLIHMGLPLALLMLPGYLVEYGSKTFERMVVRLAIKFFGTGSEWALGVQLGKLIEGFGRLWRDIGNNVVQGFFVGMGFNFLDPYRYLMRPVIKSYMDPIFLSAYGVDAFIEMPAETRLIEMLRRHLPMYIAQLYNIQANVSSPYTWEEISKYVETMLNIRGLPKKYIEFLFTSPKEAKLVFIDRFGVQREVPLAPLFELPTHSEMLRMTQKDIFPGIDVAQAVAAIRGWNPHMTIMSYLLTFKYPPFEKLWRFYMRAVSGMLWFKPPETIAKVFSEEAKAIGAGIPVPPLELQRRIVRPENLAAVELAINTYFKWLEYSNFSWFTENTQLYGIPIGKEIYQRLGGWAADSWIMADVAADIPGKVDMRWMSRYGIFLWMAKKFEELRIAFETYSPMVDIIPKLLDSKAQSNVAVDLKWFSKMLQATGLHPAWVPIVTVAENIMVISDEMTLLRTGWLNLFKEGLLTVETVDKLLSGMLTVSYLVGYWNPDTKKWETGWINLPIRWLPHEAKLLQLRMAMDRTLDLFREIYSYIRSGVRTLAITPAEATAKFTQLWETLKSLYGKVTEKIVGKALPLEIDEEYIKTWFNLQKLAQDIEAVERARYWWFRVSGWLLYRVSYGYVTKEDIENLLKTVGEAIPIHSKEMEAYRKITEAVMGIVAKERIPSPSQLATFAEYMIIPKEIVERVLKEYNVPKEYWSLWETYIKLKPVKSDFKQLITAARRAYVENVIGRDEWEAILKEAKSYGFLDVEISLYSRIADIYAAIEAAREWVPTPSMIATLSEYLELPLDLIKETLVKRRVAKEWMDIWLRYVQVKPVKSDYKALISVARRALVYNVISKSDWEAIIKAAPDYGFTTREIDIIEKVAALEEMIYQAKQYIPTPSMLASLAEYVELPRDLVMEVLEKRKVPKEWIGIWLRYITIKPVKSDYKSMLSAAARALRYGVITEAEWKRLVENARQFGFSEIEISLLQQKVYYELLVEYGKEWIPTLGTIASMVEYIEVPMELIKQVLEARRVREPWASLWLKYIQVRAIASEVNSIASELVRLLERYPLPEDFVKRVKEIMRQGGWTEQELKLYDFRIQLRRLYRLYMWFIPTIRQAVYDALYFYDIEGVIKAVFIAYGLDIQKYREQLEYYMHLAKARKIHRVLGRLYSEVVMAVAHGIITEQQARQILSKYRKYGVDDEEIDILMEVAKLRKIRYAQTRG